MNQTSSATWTSGVLIFLSALNFLLSILASLGNALILVALHKESSLHPPTKFLFRCLAVSDLCAGLISQPLFAVSVVAPMIQINYSNAGYVVTGFFFCGISVFTSTAISVDRLLALLLGLGYRHIVTLRRTLAVMACLCVIGVLCSSMHLLRSRVSWIAVIIFGLLSLVVSILCYTKIFLTLRQHQAQVHDYLYQGQSNGGGIVMNIARYKKTVSSIAWVQLALVACYVPYFIVSTLKLNRMSNGSIDMAYLATVTLGYLNSSLNPILYCWKIKEVRQAAKDTIRQCCPCQAVYPPPSIARQVELAW